jgi:DtxR family Mn-dependent transcriptional regulator
MTGGSQYLLALYIAQHRGDPPTSSGDVADLLDRSPPTVTERFQRLAEDGLVEYEPYEGATLTPEGEAAAEELHETYVTLSWFFRSVLELDDHEAEAMELAGAVSPEVADRLAFSLSREDEPPGEDGEP